MPDERLADINSGKSEEARIGVYLCYWGISFTLLVDYVMQLENFTEVERLWRVS